MPFVFYQGKFDPLAPADAPQQAAPTWLDAGDARAGRKRRLAVGYDDPVLFPVSAPAEQAAPSGWQDEALRRSRRRAGQRGDDVSLRKPPAIWANVLPIPTDGTRFQVYSEYNGPNTTGLRIRAPDNPAIYQPHKICFVLPVKPDDSTEFGDGFNELVSQNFHNLYNCTLVAPEFHVEPWIADHPTNWQQQYDKYMLALRQFCIDNLPAAAEYWIISFSKGGTSATTLFFKYAPLFDRIAIWDAPISDAEVPDGSITIDQCAYGTQANYDANYDIFALLSGWVAVDTDFFTAATKRIWLGAFGSIPAYTADMEALSDALEAESVPHYLDNVSTTGTHSWTGGGASGYWLDNAIEGLYQGYKSTLVSTAKPAAGYVVNAGDPLSVGLRIAVLFNEGSGATVRALGLAQQGTANLDTSAPAHTWGSDFFTAERLLLVASGADPLDFGAFTGLDQQDKTLIAWVRFTAQGGNQEIIDTKITGSYSFYNDDGALAFQASSGQIGVDTGPPGIPNGAVRMVVIRWNATSKNARFSIEGVNNSTVSISGASEGASADTLQFGWSLAGGAWLQVRMYNRELSDGELTSLWQNPYAGYVFVSESLDSAAAQPARRRPAMQPEVELLFQPAAAAPELPRGWEGGGEVLRRPRTRLRPIDEPLLRPIDAPPAPPNGWEAIDARVRGLRPPKAIDVGLLFPITVSGQIITAPVCLASSSAIAPSVATTVTVAADVILSTSSAVNPTLSSGATTITGIVVSSQSSVADPTVTTTVTVVPDTIQSATSVVAPDVILAGLITVTVVTSSTSATAPSVTTAVTVSADVVVSTTSVVSPTVSSAVTLSADVVVLSTTTVVAPAVTAGGTAISVGAISSQTTAIEPFVLQAGIITATVITSSTAAIAPTITGGAITLSPDVILSTTAAVTPTLVAIATLAPAALTSAVTAISPTVVVGAATVAAGVIASQSEALAPTVVASVTLLVTDVALSTTSIVVPSLTAVRILTPDELTSNASAISPDVVVGEAIIDPGVIVASTVVVAPNLIVGTVSYLKFVSGRGVVQTRVSGSGISRESVTGEGRGQ